MGNGIGPDKELIDKQQSRLTPGHGRNAERFNINMASFPELLYEIISSPQGSLFPLGGVIGSIKQGLKAPSIFKGLGQAKHGLKQAETAGREATKKLMYDRRSRITQPESVLKRSQAARERLSSRVREFEQARAAKVR